VRRSRRELRERWLARGGAAGARPESGGTADGTADQALRDNAPELNPKNRRGAPPGNKNRLVHGVYTRERAALWAEARAHIALGKQLVAAVREAFGPMAPRSGALQKMLETMSASENPVRRSAATAPALVQTGIRAGASTRTGGAAKRAGKGARP